MLIGVAFGVIAVCRLGAAELDSSDPPVQAIKLTSTTDKMATGLNEVSL
jgi:hypothetical protein